MRPGEGVVVFDRVGHVAHCEILGITKDAATLAIRETGVREPPRLALHLGIGIVQPHKLDLITQKAGEWGATSLTPVITLRSRSAALAKIDRWQRIALEAACQSEAPRLVEVRDAARLADFVGQASGRRLIMDEAGGTPLRQIVGEPGPREASVLAGPEGGWDRSEVELAVGEGFERVSLGERNFRSETAALSAIVILMHFWGIEAPP